MGWSKSLWSERPDLMRRSDFSNTRCSNTLMCSDWSSCRALLGGVFILSAGRLFSYRLMQEQLSNPHGKMNLGHILICCTSYHHNWNLMWKSHWSITLSIKNTNKVLSVCVCLCLSVLVIVASLWLTTWLRNYSIWRMLERLLFPVLLFLLAISMCRTAFLPKWAQYSF